MSPADQLLEDVGRAIKRWRGTRSEVDRAKVDELLREYSTRFGPRDLGGGE